MLGSVFFSIGGGSSGRFRFQPKQLARCLQNVDEVFEDHEEAADVVMLLRLDYETLDCSIIQSRCGHSAAELTPSHRKQEFTNVLVDGVLHSRRQVDQLKLPFGICPDISGLPGILLHDGR
jgi:hypothetical protein